MSCCRAARRNRLPTRPWLRCSQEHGFDRVQHEQIRADLKEGRIGLAQNRLPASAVIEDVQGRGCHVDADPVAKSEALAEPSNGGWASTALKKGEVAVVTLAAGAGSRWTQGAGVVKALHPFCKLAGRHRTFIETHLAKSRRVSRQAGAAIPHIFTTSYLTHAPTEEFLARQNHYGYEGPLLLSPGKSVGLRMIPTVRDLRFAWEEMPQQMLDEQQQKVRDSLRHALINWARGAGEASDYTDNLPLQCLHPVGHWYEVPNLLRNGVLARLLAERPQLKYLLLHNIDTLGADVDPGAARAAHPERRVPHLRGHHPPARRSRRRPGARQRPRPPGRGPGHAARGGRVRPELLQLEHLLD